MSAIELRGLTKVYPGGVKALDSLDLAIPDGEFFALLGPSGCGKTTLLRTIAGLETATGGAVVIGDRDVTGLQPGARDIAMVFQDYALFPHMNVTDNIAYPLRIKKVGKAARQQKAAEVGARLGLEQLMDRRPGQLSGGQQQRVALARVMATQAQAFLFDEPLSNLDARLRLEARTFLKKLQHELGVTTVFVTHDQAEALAMADRMAVMESGHIRQIGTPAEVFQRPANTFVAGFIGSTPMNLLDGVVRGDTLEVSGCKLAVPQSAEGLLHDGEKIVYGVRPEYNVYSAGPVDGSLGGNVSIVENLGASYLVTLDVNGVLVQAVVPEGHEPLIGDEGYALPRRDRALIYRDGELVPA
ncbi:sugar ABC transporter ATP-binding protein [Planotetraspora silvatica]|uniref:Sugar ABC transporter ATP-binding protein n=1 Tax=Planotetraspora silvatica TaxID=234614 RepID=A0A8J3UL25_9ACTN|nr:ABC transporter ATP-binding protein [Planotetraspora silvatica]GII46406.1 sugar ABC transporter ATP-binding protein [Planotetraspora silvatica]